MYDYRVCPLAAEKPTAAMCGNQHTTRQASMSTPTCAPQLGYELLNWARPAAAMGGKMRGASALTSVHLGLELGHCLCPLGQIGAVHQRHAQFCRDNKQQQE